MAKFRYQHIKSSVEGKAPSAAQIKVAEIAVNDFAGSEKLFIKNSENTVIDFPRGYSREYVDEIERVTSSSLNDLETRKLDATAYTPTDLSNYYQKNETSGKTEIQDALDGKSDTGHTHDDRYYTETELDGLLADKADTATTIAGYGITDAYTKSETSGATELSTEFALYVKEADIDQTIDSTTSASTGAVSTSAVYDFVTSYTPSITVDQVIDDTTSASTNPVSTKAVYSAMTENELVWANAYVTLSGEIKTHVEDTNVHLTTSEKNGLGKASGITSMDGYQIASTAAAIDPLVDTLLTAIAKLEKRIYDLEHPNP